MLCRRDSILWSTRISTATVWYFFSRKQKISLPWNLYMYYGMNRWSCVSVAGDTVTLMLNVTIVGICAIIHNERVHCSFWMVSSVSSWSNPEPHLESRYYNKLINTCEWVIVSTRLPAPLASNSNNRRNVWVLQFFFSETKNNAPLKFLHILRDE